MKKFGYLIAAVAVATIAQATPAQAAPSYCNPTVNADSTVSVTNVSFRGSVSDGCYGIVEDNDSLAVVNTLFSGGWDVSLKDETPSASDPDSATLIGYKGANWTLNSDGGTANRNWSLTISPAINPAISVDLLVVLKGSNNFAAYLFNSESFGSGGTGLFTVPFKNKNGNLQDLSHMTIYFRDGSEGCPATANIPGCLPPGDVPPVPEPTTLALFGMGLLGAGYARRRKQ
jgi:hypothetical protein